MSRASLGNSGFGRKPTTSINLGTSLDTAALCHRHSSVIGGMLDGFFNPNQCAPDDNVPAGGSVRHEQQSFEVLFLRFDSLMDELLALPPHSLCLRALRLWRGTCPSAFPGRSTSPKQL